MSQTDPTQRNCFTLARVAILAAVLLTGSAAGQFDASNPGLTNRAIGRLTSLNANGPGFLYYGVNAADRGLGYIGSYMTLGGFVPLLEDDLGGIWNADVRSHLSVNGGFFSNVGAVRKQLLGGGSLLGFGVFWDYDGDLNQYADESSTSPFGQFGHTYNQVGVSGELLTDWGNIRSNGYIPVGRTGYQLATNPNSQGIFYQHFILSQNGLDAALGGADLELGAYIPGLADWAGMINVGGYAYGNGRYSKAGGPNSGGDLVPWFGGVYTRLDLSLASNWEFSLQYNNDSFFDSTGFARLTYRMGGSRRRNVPDQMEQPMFRNEHIVRAHETPTIAINPKTNQPWQVVHVDNSALPGGTGTAESPVQSLTAAQETSVVPIADDEWTITYVHPGFSSSSGGVAINAYTGSFAFSAKNQFLIGSGGPLTIATQSTEGMSLLTIPALSTANPILSNTDPAINDGSSVVIANNNGGATIANLQIIGSLIGIRASGELSSSALDAQPIGTTANPLGSSLAGQGGSSVRNVSVSGDGSVTPQRGVQIANGAGGDPTGDIEFSDTTILNSNRQAIQVADGNANVDYFGSIRSRVTVGTNPLIFIDDTTGGAINLAATTAPASATVPNEIVGEGGGGILIQNNGSSTEINIGNTTLINPAPTAIALRDDNATTRISTATNLGSTAGIEKNSGNAAIAITGGSPTFAFNGTINNNTSTSPNGPIVGVSDTNSADITIGGPGTSPLTSVAGGIQVYGNTGSLIAIQGAELRGNEGVVLGIDEFGASEPNDITTQTHLSSLTIDLPATAGRGFEAINGGVVYTTGTNNITTASTTAAAIFVDGDTRLFGPNLETLQFVNVSSANDSVFGEITGFSLTSNGTGYTAAPSASVNLDSPLNGYLTATGVADIDPATQEVTLLTLTSLGTGYNVGDVVDLTPTDGSIFTTAAEATIDAVTPPTEHAITLNPILTGADGTIDINAFRVDGAAGTASNIFNNGFAIPVNVGGTQISP